jgi:ATP-dependent Clp protease ATP-binding subunit ClpA
LKNTTIRPEHLILAIIAKTNGVAARVLHDAGIDPDAIRASLRGAATNRGWMFRVWSVSGRVW